MVAREQHRIIWPTALVALLLAVGAAGATACGDPASGSTSAITTPTPSASQSVAHSQVGPIPAVSYAQPPVSNETSSEKDSFWVDTVGWRFKPNVDVDVTHLGFYDAEQDGLVGAHRVGIFDAATDRLVAKVVVPPASPLEGAFRWESLDKPAVLQ